MTTITPAIPDDAGPAAAAMRRYLESFTEGDMNKLIGLFAENAVVEFPYAFGAMPKRLEGTEAIARYYGPSPDLFDFRAYEDVAVYPVAGGETAFAEFTSDATVRETGADYPMRYAALMRVKDGEIVHYTEYWDASLLRSAFGSDEAVGAGLNARD